jgi:hypothetical protein
MRPIASLMLRIASEIATSLDIGDKSPLHKDLYDISECH